MKKIVSITVAAALLTASAATTASAFDTWSYAEDVKVYVDGVQIEDQYKPIIVNDRTMVRLVPIFEQLGYSHSEMDADKSVTFIQKGSNAEFRFIAEEEYFFSGTGEPEKHYLDVPATLQYYDVFYVPIRAFCEITNRDIVWDSSSRSVYITSNPNVDNTGAHTNNTAATSAVEGLDYAAAGIATGKGTTEMYNAGEITAEEIVASGEYLTPCRTSNGLTPQTALDTIKAAYGAAVTGSVNTYEDYIIANDMNTYEHYKVICYPNGSPENMGGFNQECYYIASTSADSFEESDDTNTSVIYLDANKNIIGVAN